MVFPQAWIADEDQRLVLLDRLAKELLDATPKIRFTQYIRVVICFKTEATTNEKNTNSTQLKNHSNYIYFILWALRYRK
jgi:hypothetical protein